MSPAKLRPRNSAQVISAIQRPDHVCRSCGDRAAKVSVRIVIEGEAFIASMCLGCAAQEVEHKLDLFRDRHGRVIVRTYTEDTFVQPEIPLEFIDPDLLDMMKDDDERFVVG
jgi:hypothetical protein